VKMAVFWVVAPCSLVEVYRVSEVLAASIIRAMSNSASQKTDIFVSRLFSVPIKGRINGGDCPGSHHMGGENHNHHNPRLKYKIYFSFLYFPKSIHKCEFRLNTFPLYLI
jgi:hypothetical protein